MNSKSFERYIKNPILMIGVVFVLAGCEQAIEMPETEAAFVFPEAVTVTDFKLKHPELGQYDVDSIKGNWSLFFFGYARCPDICPTELFMMAEMMRQIEKNPPIAVQTPQVVFVSLDPQQDTPELLQQYVGFYHPSFIGITGKQLVVDQLSRSMGAFYERVYHLNGKVLTFDPEDGVPEGLENSYLINHSASIFLVNPDGKLQAVFSAPHQPDVMIRDLALIQKSWHKL